MQLVSTTLTSSQILNLRTTPVEVVPAQGSGLYIAPMFILLRMHAGSNAYGNLTATLGFLINNINILPAQLPGGTLGTSYDSCAYYSISNYSSNTLNVSNLDNQAVYIKNTGLLDFTGGNGTLEVLTTFETYTV